MSVEAIPVVFTESKNDTIKYVKYLAERIIKEDFKVLVRKTTVVKSSRNKHHNIMSAIPGITIQRSKALYNHFNSLGDFFANAEKAIEIDDKNDVKIKMSLTAPGCPVADEMPGWVSDAIKPTPDVNNVDVEIVWEPQWGMEMMSDEARLELGFM